jgi:hypothetical protein
LPYTEKTKDLVENGKGKFRTSSQGNLFQLVAGESRFDGGDPSQATAITDAKRVPPNYATLID